MARWILISWIANAIALGVTAWILDGMSFHGSVGAVFVAAAIFGVLNTILKPIMRLLTLPIAVVTLGIAWFFVSLMMIWLTDVLVHDFTVSGFWTYVWATVIIWAVNVVLDAVLRPRRAKR
jgi:putative membrane protein